MESFAACVQDSATTNTGSPSSEEREQQGAVGTDMQKARYPLEKRKVSPWACASSSNGSAEPLVQNARERRPSFASKMNKSSAEAESSATAQMDSCSVPSTNLDFFDPSSDLARSPYRGFATLLCS